MAISLIVIGLTLLVAAANLNVLTLSALVGGEFRGQNNFFYWIVAFIMIGALGYIPQLRKFSIALLALVVVAIALNKGSGFFTQIESALGDTSGSASASTGSSSSSSITSLGEVTNQGLLGS